MLLQKEVLQNKLNYLGQPVLVYRDILSNTPMLAMDIASDEPPKLTKGSGKPVGGMDAVTTAIFMVV